MQYLLMAKLYEVQPKNYKDKKTGEITREFVEVTIEQTLINDEGFREKDIEHLQFDMNEYENLRKSIDKYILLPYVYRKWKSKTGPGMDSAMMLPENATYTIFDKNPFEKIEKK